MAPIPRGFLRTGHSTSFKCKYASDWDLKVVARLAKSTDAPHHVITRTSGHSEANANPIAEHLHCHTRNRKWPAAPSLQSSPSTSRIPLKSGFMKTRASRRFRGICFPTGMYNERGTDEGQVPPDRDLRS